MKPICEIYINNERTSMDINSSIVDIETLNRLIDELDKRFQLIYKTQEEQLKIIRELQKENMIIRSEMRKIKSKEDFKDELVKILTKNKNINENEIVDMVNYLSNKLFKSKSKS